MTAALVPAATISSVVSAFTGSALNVGPVGSVINTLAYQNGTRGAPRGQEHKTTPSFEKDDLTGAKAAKNAIDRSKHGES
jgi:hypothetical protein